MKKIFIHIGTFKTGSTSLQYHMHKNRKQLLENDFYYGDYYDKYYLHSNLCYGILEEALKSNGLYEKYKNHPRFLNIAENPDKIIERIKKNSKDYSNIIISHEAFFADSFRTLIGLRSYLSEEVKKEINMYIRLRLKELLSSFIDKIIIVCYLRRQDLFMESQYNQYCKDVWYGDKIIPDFEEFLNCKPIELNYYTTLKEWQEVFPEAEFIVTPYEKESFKNGLIDDFYTNILKINFQKVKHFKSIDLVQSNQRLDRNVLEYKKMVNFLNNKLNALFKEYSISLSSINDFSYFSYTRRKTFLKQFDNQNNKVAKEFLKKKDGILFSNTNMDFPEYEGLKEEKIIEITRWLFDKLL